MIVWDGEAMHAAIQRYLKGERAPIVPAEERCVNEGADGCTVRAETHGWCAACWATIVPVS